jgi:hypothetical protein
MTPHSDHPDLTAYALGEPHADHVAEWMEDPALREQVDSIADLANHLQATTTIPTALLHPHQRAAVLTPPERVRQLVEAAKAREVKPKHRIGAVAWGTVKWSAAAALVVGSFVAGTQISDTPEAVAAIPPKAPTSGAVKADPVVQSPPVVQDVAPQVQAVAKVEAPAKTEASPIPTATVASILVAGAEPALQIQPRSVIDVGAVLQANRQADSRIAMQPRDLVAPRVSGGVVAGARLPKASAPAEAERERAVDLRIHSWSADVMACPWKAELRLVRVAFQLPSVQARNIDFGVELSFDPNTVRHHRHLGQRIIPAVDSTQAAQVIVWHEVLPNGQVGSAAAPRKLGTVKLPDARFTTPAMAPFDGSSLRIVDKGHGVSEARDDFRFETALIGFTLLMKGDATKPEPSLLKALATEALAAGDPYGERAKLVKLLTEAQAMTGL